MRRPRDARPVLEWPQDRSAGVGFSIQTILPYKGRFFNLERRSALAERSHLSVKWPTRVGHWPETPIWEASLVQCPRINWTGRVLRSIGVHRCSSAANELFSRAFALVQPFSVAADEHR